MVLDPIVTGEAKASTIDDRTVCANKTYGKAETFLLCGYYGNWGGIHRTYLKYDDDALPQLNGSETVVKAELGLFEYNSNLHSYNTTVEVHKVTESWTSSSITWNTQPAYDSHVEDYCVVGKNGDGAAAGEYAKGFLWNITGTVRDWYSGDNNGVMLKATDAAETSKVDNWTYLRSSDSDCKPVLYVYFRHNSGIEPYYSYQTLSAGHAGTAYICDSTGQLKVQKSIASYASTVNSFGANLVYNSDYFAQNSTAADTIQSTHGIDMRFGNGFTLAIIQSVKKAELDNAVYDYLVWHDGDGTDHYFYREKGSTGDYEDEDGLNLAITVSGSDYTMKNDQGYTWFFDDGLLSEMYDETGNKIWIDWQGSGNSRWFKKIYQRNKNGSDILIVDITYLAGTSYINTLTDAAGRVYGFTYTGGRLTAIHLNSIQIVAYSYNNGQTITNRLVGMKDKEALYQLWYEYNDQGKIATYQEWGAEQYAGAIVEVTYDDEMTTYRDYGADRTKNATDDILTYYIFDYFGRTVNAYSTDPAQRIIGASNAAYTGSGKDTDNPKTNNRVEKTASIGIPAQNILKNHGFESGTTGWTLSSASNFSASTYSRHTGEKALQGWMDENFSGSSISAHTSVSLTKNTTYTFSAYVDTRLISKYNSGGYVHLIITNNAGDSAWSEALNYSTAGAKDGWARLSATITPKTTGSYALMVQAVGVVGWFYVDDVQLERGEAPSNHNLIENGNLDINQYGWLMQQGGSYFTNTGGNKVLRCAGDPSQDACAWQNVPIELPGTETYVLSGWANAYSVPDNDNAQENEDYAGDTTKSFGLRATVRYTDGTQEHHYAPFCPDVKDAWQFVSLTVVLKEPTKTVDYIQVVCAYEKKRQLRMVRRDLSCQRSCPVHAL